MTEIIALAQATQEQINALRFAERESRTIIPVLAAIAANVKAMLGRKKHNVALVRTIRDATRAMLDDWQNGYIDNLEGFGASIVESTVDGIDALVEPNVFEAKTPPIAAVYSASLIRPMPIGTKGTSVFVRDMFAAFPRENARIAANQVRAGFVNGSTNAEIARQVQTTLNTTANAARRLTRTSTSNLAATARQSTFEFNDDMIIGQQFIATLDNRTSSQCRSLDGRKFIYKKNPKIPVLPLHYNERSTYAPILIGDEDEEEDRRPEISAESSKESDGFDRGTTSSSKKYYTFLAEQPKWYIDEVMGVKNGKAFRSLVKAGDMSPSTFADLAIDSSFQPLTLEQMAAKNKKVNKYLKSLGE